MFGLKIFSFIYIFGMFALLVIVSIVTRRAPTSLIVYLVLFGLALLWETITFIFGIRERIA